MRAKLNSYKYFFTPENSLQRFNISWITFYFALYYFPLLLSFLSFTLLFLQLFLLSISFCQLINSNIWKHILKEESGSHKMIIEYLYTIKDCQLIIHGGSTHLFKARTLAGLYSRLLFPTSTHPDWMEYNLSVNSM